MNKKAAVIGAGISGLYASLLLEKNGYSVDLYERDCRIGGRMTSDIKSGFILDRGFHVLQTGYQFSYMINTAILYNKKCELWSLSLNIFSMLLGL